MIKIDIREIDNGWLLEAFNTVGENDISKFVREWDRVMELIEEWKDKQWEKYTLNVK